MRYLLILINALFALIPTVLGHTWIEQMKVIDSTGAFTGDTGYARGWFARGEGWSDKAVQQKIEVFDDAAAMCRFPKVGENQILATLKASPGDNVALLYNENGHVSFQTESKPKSGGIVYIYGTTDPKPDDKLKAIWKKWTVDGKGGDGRGSLLAVRKYDDGQCHEPVSPNFSQEKLDRIAKDGINDMFMCQNDITLPDNLKPGEKYTIYWVWDYSTMKTDSKAEEPTDESRAAMELYTSCMDIDIVAGSGTSKNLAYSATDIQNSGIKSQLTQRFDVERPKMGATNGANSNAPPIPGNQRENKPKAPAAVASQDPSVAPAESKSSDIAKPTPAAPAPVTTVTVTKDGSVAAATVTVTADGPVSTVTEKVYIAVGSSYIEGQESKATATSSANSKASSLIVPTTFATQVSSQNSGASNTGRPEVNPFMNKESSIINASLAFVAPTSPSALSTSIASAAITLQTSVNGPTPVASEAVPTTTGKPQQDNEEEVFQTVTVEATITTSETVTETPAKALPTISQTQARNGTVLPRMRRVRRAL